MIAFIDDHRQAYGVEPICRVLPIAQSTSHAHAATRADPIRLSTRTKRDDAPGLWLDGKLGPISECVSKLRVVNAILEREVVTLGKTGLRDIQGHRHQLGTFFEPSFPGIRPAPSSTGKICGRWHISIARLCSPRERE